jgi:SAM-dependent methyltransferase
MNDQLADVVSSYEREVATHLAGLGHDPASEPTRTTIATNSTLLETRGRPLVELAMHELGRPDLHGVSVVDLGCGYGALAALFAIQGAQVLGVDLLQERLEIGSQVAEAHALDITFRMARLERPRVHHAAFDLALVNNSLCYVLAPDARQRVLEEAYRALRPGGLLIVRDPNRLHPRDNFTGLPLIGMLPPRPAKAAARILGKPRSAVRLRTPREGRCELERAGFIGVRSPPSPSRLRRWVGGYNLFVARRPLA